ncbi:MAG TPA: DUF1003 domain-containing protein [Vicinamibacterales bacterium]|nr:DUF1003 domain-containing protein [Vicinamibacterales bacterium]
MEDLTTHASHSPSDQNIRAIVRLEEASLRARSRADRMARTLTRAAGSGLSILLHAVSFTVWFLLNATGIFGTAPFDPFPFNLLTMIVSIEVIFLSLVVLLNQNRMAAEADKRAHLNLQVDLLAEREMTLILRMLRELSDRLGVSSQVTHELEGLLKDTDVREIASKLERALPNE